MAPGSFGPSRDTCTHWTPAWSQGPLGMAPGGSAGRVGPGFQMGGGQGALEADPSSGYPLRPDDHQNMGPHGQVTFQVPRGWGGEDRPSAPRMAAALGPLCKCPFIKPSSSCPKEGLCHHSGTENTGQRQTGWNEGWGPQIQLGGP